MKWIKASERTPDKEGDYYVKYTTGKKEVLYASGTEHHSRWRALVDEWLDEEAPDWSPIKPEWKEDCLLLTASKVGKHWEYRLYEIVKTDGYDANQHEGWAVIKEEFDELWDEVKKNQKNYDIPAMRKEATQCAAMCIRFIAELCEPAPPKIEPISAPPTENIL